MRVAVIGAGAIGRTHVETIATTEGFELAGIADPFDAGAQLAATYGTTHYRDHHSLIAAEQPEAAVIGTPNELHVAQAIDFLAAGIPVLVEKPVATTYAEAQTLVRASESSGVPVLVGHHRRYHPAVVRAKEIVESGRLGQIVAVGATYFLSKPPEYFDIPWHRTPGRGGTFLINLIHEIDLLRHLVGEITSVAAMASSTARGLEVEDTGALSVAFANGALASLIISDTVAAPWSWDLTAGDSPRFPAHDVESHRIGGTAASLTLPTLEVWEHGGTRSWTTEMHAERENTPWQSPYTAQLHHLGEVAAGRVPPRVSAREGARNLAVMEAISHAVATGSTASVAD